MSQVSHPPPLEISRQKQKFDNCLVSKIRKNYFRRYFGDARYTPSPINIASRRSWAWSWAIVRRFQIWRLYRSYTTRIFTDYSAIIIIQIRDIFFNFFDYCCIYRQTVETTSDCANENTRYTLRLNSSHETRKVERFSINRWIHESCGTGLRVAPPHRGLRAAKKNCGMSLQTRNTTCITLKAERTLKRWVCVALHRGAAWEHHKIIKVRQ